MNERHSFPLATRGLFFCPPPCFLEITSLSPRNFFVILDPFPQPSWAPTFNPAPALPPQTDHWRSKNYSLFISVVRWLKTKEWDKREWKDALEPGDEVTVDGELSSEPMNKKSFFAVVIKRDEARKLYVLSRGGMEDPDTFTRPREDLRHRVRHTVCISSVSDDKKVRPPPANSICSFYPLLLLRSPSLLPHPHSTTAIKANTLQSKS
jgi:hypothetical protein